MLLLCHKDKSAASSCHQMAALFPYLFHDFYLGNNHKIANKSTNTEAREKISTYLESLEFLCTFDKI